MRIHGRATRSDAAGPPRRGTAWLPLLLALSCAAPETEPGPHILVTVAPLAHPVKRLVGEELRVGVLIPPGANPTTHAPTVADRRALAGADLLVVVDHPAFPFERTWLGPLTAERPDLPRAGAGRGADEVEGDPHVWTDPARMREFARRLEAALVARWPERAETFRANRARFDAEVDALDAELAAILEPVRGRAFFIFHPAWGHFARRYGLEQVALEQDHKEPGPHALAETIGRAGREGARVVFVQPQFDRTHAELVAREIGAELETLDPLAEDWPGTLRRTALALAEALRS